MQHGDEPEDARRVDALACEATERGDERARWLLYQGKPQTYGTQDTHDGIRHRLWDVSTFAEPLRNATEAMRIDPPHPTNREDAPWCLKEALLRWRESEITWNPRTV